MAGLLNSLPPGLAGFVTQRQLAAQDQNNQLGQIRGLLGIQQAQMQQGLLGQQLADKQRQQAQIEAYAQTLPPEKRAGFLVNPQAFFQEANKRHVVQGNLVDNSGGVLFQAPRKKENINGVAVDLYDTQAGSILPQDPNKPFIWGADGKITPNMPFQSFSMNKAAAGAPRVNVSTEKKYGEMFAGKVADSDVSLMDTARKAPALAERANNIRDVLDSGKVITGMGADYRLALGKALNLAGTDNEVISNTEVLATDLARNTLDSIKTSGLGAGNGFSNADRDFLEKAAGGKITLEANTIRRLADLSYRAAEQSAGAWNKRVGQIPESALSGTGVDRNPINVPKYEPKKNTNTTLTPAEMAELEALRKRFGKR